MVTSRNKAHTFFDTHVRPSVESWQKHPIDIRLAMQAAIALNQMADHFWHAYGTVDPGRVFGAATSAAFYKELAARNLHFALLRDVAEAHKHVKLDRPGRSLTGAEQTSVGTTGYGGAGFGTAPWDGGPSIVIELDDGGKEHLSMLVDQVVLLWHSMLS